MKIEEPQKIEQDPAAGGGVAGSIEIIRTYIDGPLPAVRCCDELTPEEERSA